jgi:hypothetical protein
MQENNLTGRLRKVLVAAAAVAVVIAAMGAWNLAMPELFGLPRAEFSAGTGLNLAGDPARKADRISRARSRGHAGRNC